MSQIMREVLAPVHRPRLSVLSGPSFAREVVDRRPTAVVAAADDPAIARRVQHALSGGPLRVYAGTDPLGVELGGAIKNVIAIAAGIVDGLALGTNARAALVTRGLAEMTRLGVTMGAEARTFAGLAGMGDLILTCTGDLSRNRTLGRKLVEWAQPAKLVAGSRTVAEGVNACRSVRRLAERHAVEMPICAAVHRVLFEAQDAGRQSSSSCRATCGSKGDWRTGGGWRRAAGRCPPETDGAGGPFQRPNRSLNAGGGDGGGGIGGYCGGKLAAAGKDVTFIAQALT
jgi:glycerol-3-phosphate dehydrogenase (NAD(P)+)